jgi:Xaa-Pro dipeptidase
MSSDATARPISKEIAFPNTEYAGRLAKVRTAMAEAQVDCFLVTYPANVCYLTGFKGTYANWYSCLIVPGEGPPILQTCEHELAQLYTDVRQIDYVRWDKVDETAIPQLVKSIRACAGEPKRIGLEPRRDGLTAHMYGQLRGALSAVDFVDLSDLVLQLRQIKSEAEIEYLRKAAQISVLGFDAAANALRPGCSENDIAAAAMAAMISAGSEMPSTSPFIRAGARSSVMHATWRRHPIRPGDPVVLELGAVYERYTAPAYGTAVIGDPSKELIRLFELCRASVDVLHQNLRPGRTVADVARTASEGLRKLGPDVAYVERHGYCVGIGFPPDWVEHSLVIAPEYEDVLQPGMVFHTPRSLRIAGVMSAGYSDTVLITEHGCEILTPHRRELIVM